MRKNSIKNTRLNEEVMRELSTIIRNEIKDPRIHPLTTVSAVQVAPDLKTCKVYISVLGDKKEKEDTIAGLKNGINLHGVWRQPMKVFMRNLICRNLLVKNLRFKLL